MLKVGIVGFGNVGKSLYAQVKQAKDIELTAVYSRRRLDIPEYQPIENLIGADACTADVMLIALGSFKDMTQYMPTIAGKCNTVDSYDNHATMEQYKMLLCDKQKKSKKVSVVAVGWDPGLLSIERALLTAFTNDAPSTFWGKGISQGHTNALKTIPEVKDALQLTIPIRRAVIKKQTVPLTTIDAKKTHQRLCYVYSEYTDKSIVADKIRSIPDYFEGYKTIVRFVSKNQLQNLKEKCQGHSGLVIANDGKTKAQFCLNIDNNAYFTAQIMLCYAKAIPQLLKHKQYGTLDCLDIPLKYLVTDKKVL